MEEIRRFVQKEMKPMLNAMREKAMGISMVSDQGKLYKLAPDPAAAKLLWEYAFGKPNQPVGEEDPDTGEIVVKVKHFKDGE